MMNYPKFRWKARFGEDGGYIRPNDHEKENMN
jgi:hypothetical protein